MIRLSEDTYRNYQNEYNGICVRCGYTRWGETEPDARNYPCEECETNNVYGIDELLVMGQIIIDDDIDFDVIDFKPPRKK